MWKTCQCVVIRCLVLILLGSIPLWAQPPDAAPALTEMQLGRAAIDRDPAAAIAHFEKVDTPEGHAWLAVALMMESRAASDGHVERAFEAAARSRVTDPSQFHTRKQIASALKPGDLVIAYFVGETAAYAWAFDRDAFVGYQLPPPSELAVSVDRARGYVEQHDEDGQKRIADDLLPQLLGPAMDSLDKLDRVIVVMDGPLQRLPPQFLDAHGARAVVVPTDYASIMDTIARPVPPRARRGPGLVGYIIAIAAILAAWGASRRARRRSRAQS